MLTRLINEQVLETPFFGVLQITRHMRHESHLVNRKRIRLLMRLMGLMPNCQKPYTRKAAKDLRVRTRKLHRSLAKDWGAAQGNTVVEAERSLNLLLQPSCMVQRPLW